MAEPGKSGNIDVGDRLTPFLGRWIDPMVQRRADPRIAAVVLGAAMLVSFVYCLWVTRGTTFSGDELTWVALSPSMDLKGALTPHSGHLVLVSHTLYKLVLGTIGTHYLFFRVLTLITVYVAAGLLFVYGSRRVGPWLALAPSVVLVFFGSDTGHLLQGNGFTIMLALACGVLALLALEGNSGRGDVVACLALCLGVLTYTVALPFVCGAALLLLLGQNRRSRLWVVALPALIYLSWRVWILTADISVARGELDPANLAVLPAWTFQSLGDILSALTGFHYDFSSDGRWLPSGEVAGPALALIFVIAAGLRIGRGRVSGWFWAAVVIALAMFASQVLVWIPDVRGPGDARYLFPGAFVVLLIAYEAVRGLNVSRAAFISVWLVALVAWSTNVVIIQKNGETLRDRDPGVRAEVTAVAIEQSAGSYIPGPAAKPLTSLVSEAPIAIIGPAQEKYGGLGLSADELRDAPAESRAAVDAILGGAYGPVLVPVTSQPDRSGCERVSGMEGTAIADLPPGGAVLESKTGGTVTLRRFGDAFSTTVGALLSGEPMTLNLPKDTNPTPWQVSVPAESLLVCPVPPVAG